MKTAVQFILIFSLVPYFVALQAQDPKQKGFDAITEQAVMGQLEFLSSDWTQGRSTGTEGAYMSADYIASLFKVYGLQPAGDVEIQSLSREERMAGKKPSGIDTYFQNFNLLEYKNGEEHELALVEQFPSGERTTRFALETDFSLRASDVAESLEAPVVFVGYGLRDKESGYDDFKGIDVKGKVILRLSGYPGQDDPDSRGYKAFHSKYSGSGRGLRRDKSQVAEELGAAAVIEVQPGSDDVARNWASNLPFRYNSANYEGTDARESYYETRMMIPGDKINRSPIQISVSDRVINAMLDGTTIDLVAFRKEVSNSMKPASLELPGKRLKIRTTVDSKIIRARNVVGVLPGRDTSEIIVIGAHYDHLGIHEGWIWNGADDNASGTVGMMTIAKACMATGEKPQKTIVFCAWTGEEKGLLGSEYFADHPYNHSKVILNLNFDMISRDNKDDTLGVKCTMNYTKAYPVLEELTAQNIGDFGLNLDVNFRPSERPGGGSDHASFSRKDIPVIYFEAGFPPEYHQPNDHIELVNPKKMTNIIRTGYLTIWDLANREWGPSKTE
jgi:hypothetical protein